MAYSIRWSPKASDNLENIFEYISKDSPYYATITVVKISEIIDSLTSFPYRGRIIPEYENPNLREVIYKNYRITYRLNGNYIEIAAITHTARKFRDL